MGELVFKVSSELKNILGRDLITNDYIAILELVKNSYDASATKVEITFAQDSITIADNGKGMSYNDIVNKWLFVGYSAKRDGTEDKESDYRHKMKRNYAGAKGIGRLSCDRLSQQLVLTTCSNESNVIENLEIDWSKFEVDQSKEFDDVKIPYNSLNKKILFPNNSHNGTILKLKKLHSEWSRPRIISLKKALEKLINPFAETNDFVIEIKSSIDLEQDNKILSEIKVLENKPILSDKERIDIADKRNKLVNGIVENRIADILSLKTTQIESILKDGVITTRLTDRGILMYEIQEKNDYNKLSDVTVNLYYLNRVAKYNFSMKMGVQPVQYGSVFLFRNGFRILPYGNEKDDSWKLDQRAQQGYARFLGTRDLIGRVDVETENVEEFKEVSSRDGGLIESPSTIQLFDYFTSTHRRLERYVSGVLWGEAFLRKEYFKNAKIAQEQRDKLQSEERDSSSASHIYKNIGSRVDFLQLVKSLVNDKNIQVLYYNADLANILAGTSDTEIIQTQFVDDLETLATETNDQDLIAKIEKFRLELDNLYKQKRAMDLRFKREEERRLEAEKLAQEEETKRVEAEKKYREAQIAKEEAILKRREEEAKRKEAELKKIEAELVAKEQEAKRKEAELKRKEEEKKRMAAEIDRDAQIMKNQYLSSVRNTSQEVEDLIHTILISSNELDSLVKIISSRIKDKSIDESDLISNLDAMAFHIMRVNKLSKLITKADISMLSSAKKVDLKEYVQEYLSNFSTSVEIAYKIEYRDPIIKKISLLDLSVILDNLVSNSKKAGADKILIVFNADGRKIIMDFSDNGCGVDFSKYTSSSIFEEGVTNRRGGSGIGLSTIRTRMEKDMNGEIQLLENGLYFKHGATFRLVFN